VDINPMAVELCKVSLWLEALEPGKPLSFLDHHIRVGNSLLGATPELIAQGIPDDAFKPIEGDDKAACTMLKKRNKAERRGMGGLFIAEDVGNQESLRRAAFALETIGDETHDDVKKKAKAFEDSLRSYGYVAAKAVADAWCAAFFIQKRFEPGTKRAVGLTQEHLSDLAKGIPLPEQLGEEVDRLARQYQFFHWHLAFPEVFSKGGFDCELGNPPWDMVELSEKEFFAPRKTEIANAPSARQRQQMIQALGREDLALFQEFTVAKRVVYSVRHFIQCGGRYPYSCRGRINLYPLFVENGAALVASRGRVGIVVPSAISMDAYNAPLFSWVVETRRLVSLFDFDNTQGLFPDVDSRYRLCLLTLSGRRAPSGIFAFCFYAHSTAEISDSARRINLSPDEIRTFSPKTLAPPMFLNAKDASIAKVTYANCGVLVNQNLKQNPWSVSIQRMLSLSDPGDMFRKKSEMEHDEGSTGSTNWARLYSGKAIHQFEHRFATYTGQKWRPITVSELKDRDFSIDTEYYVRSPEVAKRIPETQQDGWLLVYRDVTNATNERTAIAAVIPRVGCDTTCRNIYSKQSPDLLACFLCNTNSLSFDYFVRQKVIGMHLGAGVFEQLPVLSPLTYSQLYAWSADLIVRDWLLPRVLELTYTSWELKPFAQDCGSIGPPFRWDEERRFLIRCELDAAFFHLYLPGTPNGEWRMANRNEGAFRDETPEELDELKRHFPTPRDAVAYIMDTFPIVRRKDEEKHGEYRTRRIILEIYDEMAEAMRTGVPYKTRLNPPPGPPADEQGNFLPLPDWQPGQPKPKDWPPHIHPPKEVLNCA
jgi:hypothetical protein